MNFNIENYLNSLPDNTEIIDVSNKDITYIPDLSRFKNLKTLICSFNLLTSLPALTENLEYLDCSYNQINKLPTLNEYLIYLDCSENHLTHLPILNIYLITLICSSNFLKTISELNEKLELLDCSNNQLFNLYFLNKNLKTLNCSANDLIKLPYLYNNNNLKYLDCSFNKLYSFPFFNENLRAIICYDNPLYEMLDNKNYSKKNLITKTKILKKIKILNNFIFLFYCLKFKKQFRDWLWIKIREPKIKDKYKPSYLNNLDENTNLEEYLNNW